ncbi:copper chaperone PCu(A)C [Variovorax sp. YR752]|uniref:copper chaperone PCu(A)C n=1 Tax=Variovorax sp. YR752 TaxID=1884383 RepID=UPI00313833AA
MAHPFPRRSVLRTGLALCASLALPQARACEYFADGLRITHPWTRATAPGATTAVLCMGFDEVLVDDRLIAVETPVAEGAEMGGLSAGREVNFAIPAGQSSALGEHGSFVRLVGLKHPLEVGRTYPLNLGFERAGLVIATLNVDFARFR